MSNQNKPDEGVPSVIYLSPEFLRWHRYDPIWEEVDPAKVERSYALLHHAESLLRGAPTTFNCADAVANLKRAINVRLQLLDESYGFPAAFPRNVGALERLQKVGLARPVLVKQLFELRNEIEHKDALPPTHERCRELVDLTWYFLRATEPAARIVQDSLLFEPESRQSGLYCALKLVSVGDRRLAIHGVFPMSFCCSERAEGLMPIHVSTFDSWEFASEESNLMSEGRFIDGETIVTDEVLYRFWELMFLNPPLGEPGTWVM